MIAEVVRFVRRSVDPSIEIECAAADPLDWVMGDESSLYQLLLNLCLNARDALTARARSDAAPPRIRVSASSVSFEATPSEENPLARSGRHVRLAVEDNGVGMSAKVARRAFEPFFTTKEVGEGTGLGLAVVHGIVRQHDGWTTCASTPGEGTVIRAYLPATAPETSGEAAAEQTVRAPRVARILVVDDEELVRDLATTILQRCGHEVHTAENTPAALALCREGGLAEGLDLVLVDLSMPGPSGAELCRALRRDLPRLRIVMWSGHPREEVEAKLGAARVDAILPKPFRPEELRAAVAKALGDPVR